MQAIAQFCDFYQQLTSDKLQALDDIYSEQVLFVDPVTEHQGLSQLRLYFENLLANTPECRFTINSVHHSEQDHFIRWTMFFRHPRLGNKLIEVTGLSHLQVSDGKISYHRDYYDMGEMIYQHVPLLGRLINYIKGRLAQ